MAEKSCIWSCASRARIDSVKKLLWHTGARKKTLGVGLWGKSPLRYGLAVLLQLSWELSV